MPGSTSRQATDYGFVRSALMLLACVFAVALVLLPYAINQAGSAGPFGLAAAAGICLVSGLAAEAASYALTRSASPLAGQLSGTIIRMLLPLFACLILALQGFSGRENLAFVCYLLTFYMSSLVMETRMAVKRVAATPGTAGKSAR
jgi:hypothetical protein